MTIDLQLLIDRATADRAVQAAIAKDIQERFAVQAARVAARLRSNAEQSGLFILANGDSWFDYPLEGNDELTWGHRTDVIYQLETRGNPPPVVLNVAHLGDATTDEMAWQRQERMREALTKNSSLYWGPSGKPDAILFSGGGNDIAGDKFCIYLNAYNPGPGHTVLNVARFNGVLQSIAASYNDLLDFRDTYAAGVPIYANGYDFPIPNGARLFCAGPWLKPSFDYLGYPAAAMPAMRDAVRQALRAFRDMLLHLQASGRDFYYVETQGTLQDPDWANELHPEPDGFAKIGERFLDALRSTRFGGRI